MAGFEQIVGVLKAAGETTRLRLLALLAEGELSVKDITDIVGQSQPRVSRHLKLLADAGLVSRHAEGAWAYYRLADRGELGDVARWLAGQIDASDPLLIEDRHALENVRLAHESAAAAYFASVAESWDRLRGLHVPEAAVEQRILDVVGPEQLDLVLDLGTGTGRMLDLLSPRYARGLGIDSSREMLGVARAKLTAAKLTHAQVRLGDINALDPGNGPADLIIFHQVLHYFDDPGRIILQAEQLLGPGGRMLIVDFAPHRLEFLRDEQAHRRLGISDEQMIGWADGANLKSTCAQQFPSTNEKEGLTVCLWLLESGHEETYQ